MKMHPTYPSCLTMNSANGILLAENLLNCSKSYRGVSFLTHTGKVSALLTPFQFSSMLQSSTTPSRQGSTWVAIVAAILLTILAWPVWEWLWREWLGNQYYSHGILIPFVSIYLAIRRFQLDRAILEGHLRGSAGGLLLLGVSLIGFVAALYNKTYFVAAFAMIGVLAGLVWVIGSSQILYKLRFPIGYLALMVPLPFLDRFTLPLALFTGVCSGGLVRMLGLNIEVIGNAVKLPNANLVIGAQCSGVNSLITLIALTTLAAYLVSGPTWGRLLLILAAIPLALIGNILRVASLIYVARWFGADSAFTFYHDYSGILFFIVAMALLYPLGRLLQCTGLRLSVI